MDSRLVRNGAVLCDLVPSVLHAGVPADPDGKWHECTLVTRSRIIPDAKDVFEILSNDGTSHPFEITTTRIGAEGWEVAGKVLF
jgi:hypothetical protein